MDKYEIESMFGQGTFGRLYKAHLRGDLTDEQLPAWVAHRQQAEHRRRQAEEQEQDQEPTDAGASTAESSASERDPTLTPRAVTPALRHTTLVIKEVPFQGLPPQEQQDILNEVHVMSAVSHPTFIAYYESFLDNGCLYIVMELAENGDLSQLLARSKPTPMTECEIWRYLLQLLEGLSYLHAQRILHRDLKPANIFLDSSMNIKIGDLGLGRILGSKSIMARTNLGTPLYFSPELCMDQPYDEKSDVWSLGCLAYEMATFQPPFLASNQIALAKKIVHDQPAPLPSSISSELRFLIMKMLEKDPAKRPSMDQMRQYSPVKLRQQVGQLTHTVERLRSRMRHRTHDVDGERKHHQHEMDLLRQQIQFEQQHGAQIAQHAQSQYEKLRALLQSAEHGHSTLVDRVRSLEHEAQVSSDTLDQYQMQLAREQQEKHQLERQITRQEQQIQQQLDTVHGLTVQIEQLKQQQQQQFHHAQQTHHQQLQQGQVLLSPLPSFSRAPPDHSTVVEPARMASPTPTAAASSLTIPSSSPPLPPRPASSPTLTLLHTATNSPHVSPAAVRYNKVKVTRTPGLAGLGPALRVPVAVQSGHPSPSKSHAAPSTVTPRKKTPAIGGSAYASAMNGVSHTPIPRLDWQSAHSPSHSAVQGDRSRFIDVPSRDTPTPELRYTDSPHELSNESRLMYSDDDDSCEPTPRLHQYASSDLDSPLTARTPTSSSAHGPHLSLVTRTEWSDRISAAAQSDAPSPSHAMEFMPLTLAKHPAGPLNPHQLAGLLREAGQRDL